LKHVKQINLIAVVKKSVPLFEGFFYNHLYQHAVLRNIFFKSRISEKYETCLLKK